MKEQFPLYLPQEEHDACGIGFVADLNNHSKHEVVEQAITMLENMEHRGACGCDPLSGDGAGIMVQKPHHFFSRELKKQHISLPARHQYGVAMVFYPSDDTRYFACKRIMAEGLQQLNLRLIAERVVPYNASGLSEANRETIPVIEQAFIESAEGLSDMALERKLYLLKNYVSNSIHDSIEGTRDAFYIPSCSYRTIIYKGQLTTFQLKPFYNDLSNPDFKTAIALVHSRFSTNTFPKWKLAQPFRFIAHNGEINTVLGNVNWMRARETMLKSKLFSKEELNMLKPICDSSRSDSANLDNIIELLYMDGRSLPEVMMMLIPEAWQQKEDMEPHKRAFYQYHASLIEPWDGPASVCFTDGVTVGATLDRNGLRPSRYCLTHDNLLVMSSEAGALPVDESRIARKGRLQPGKMFIADLEEGRIISDKEIKEKVCTQQPYQQWLDENQLTLEKLPDPVNLNGNAYKADSDELPLIKRQINFGYTSEDLKVVLGPMVENAKEPIGSMGADTPLAVLSEQPQQMANYFKQLFAQVSNPPIDPIRERPIMSLKSTLGASDNLLGATPEHCRQIALDQPVLTNTMLNKIRYNQHPHFQVQTLEAHFIADDKPGRLKEALDNLCKQAEQAVRAGATILILSDRNFSASKAPVPSLLATGSVHHHLIRTGLRGKSSLVVECGDARETHHFATLIGYGAHAVNPYLAFESIHQLASEKKISTIHEHRELEQRYINALGYGLLKVFSKMGISTLQSYHGAQVFEAVGLHQEVIDFSFTRTVSRISGVNFDTIAKEVLVYHRAAFPEKERGKQRLGVGGVYQWKLRGEKHLFNPKTIHLIQYSTRNNNYEQYKEYAEAINNQTRQASTLRGLLDFKPQKAVPLDEVEPVEAILKRFATGAMSFGSLSHEAHATLAVAMNRIGGKSNSGEGGEDEIRFERKPNGDWERSAIKQVASGRFGVTSNYLTNAEELQIKMAQGAKPGEGGQLPGHKVDDWIGKVRYSTPGVGLISPPPHHDIYSIEDLAQLIFDLKNANREARINVKLVAKAGVGTIAAGVAKAHADVILISGYDGGTGASPISSIRHAGVPWELGLAESHQTLVKNDLRSRVTLQVDGQIKTGKDIATAILLGAEEFGVSTAALVTMGCIMMRKCHLNTCPVGVATQNEELRKLFTGDPDHVVTLFRFLAQDLREIMASLGFRTINEMVGRADVLSMRNQENHWKRKNLNLNAIIQSANAPDHVGTYKQQEQDHGMSDIIDWQLLEEAIPALEEGKPVTTSFNLKSTDRSVGTLVANEVSKRYGSDGLPENSINFSFTGSAGQSFGAFTAPGMTLTVNGEANDYFGKGLSGAKLILRPNKQVTFKPEANSIVGNVAFYGATSGKAYIRGQAGERFAVRNSGANVVVEGIGDHGCEYMTGGLVIVLGETGANFAAGMSGGVAYIYDNNQTFEERCNQQSVEIEPLNPEDLEIVQQMLREHEALTDSEVARNILSDWASEAFSFRKVMPTEYRAVLEKKNLSLQQVMNIEKQAV